MPSLQPLASWHLAVWLGVVAVAGCGRQANAPTTPTHPVRGQVRLDDQPLPGVLVVFHPRTPTSDTPVRSFARTRADGTFVVSTFQENDGAPAGHYRVSVIASDEDDGPRRLPRHYADPARSGIEVEIKEGENQLQPFRLLTE